MRHVQVEPTPSPEPGPSQPPAGQGGRRGGLLMGFSQAGGTVSQGVYQVSVFSPLDSPSEPRRALKRPGPPTEGDREAKRGPGTAGREGQPHEEPASVGPSDAGLSLGLGGAGQHFSHRGLQVVEHRDSPNPSRTTGAWIFPGPLPHASYSTLHTRDWGPPEPRGIGLGETPGSVASSGQLHILDADLHSLAQKGEEDPGPEMGNGSSPWPGEPPGTANGHSPEHTPPGPAPLGPCPAKRRLLPAGETPDANSGDEGPAPRRHRSAPSGPSPAARSTDAKAAPFWNHLLPISREPMQGLADSSPTGRRLKGARRLKLSSLRSFRKGPGLLISPSAPPVPTLAVSRTLLGNFEESLLRGRFVPSGHIEGFTAEIGASGSYCPQHVTLPVAVTFFDVSEHSAPAPFLGVVDLNPLGRKGYGVPKAGTVQVTLFNPNQTVVKMFLVTFDFSDMPAAHVTFLRHRLFLVPVGEEGSVSPTRRLLCYLLHLRFRSSRSGRLYLHGDIRLLFSRRSLELDTGLPYELQALTEAPQNPRYSPLP